MPAQLVTVRTVERLVVDSRPLRSRTKRMSVTLPCVRCIDDEAAALVPAMTADPDAMPGRNRLGHSY